MKYDLEISAKLAEAKMAAEKEKLIKLSEHENCDHGVVFDEEEFNKNPNMSSHEVRKKWPRGFGPCPKGCGWDGIAYASSKHYYAGDW